MKLLANIKPCRACCDKRPQARVICIARATKNFIDRSRAILFCAHSKLAHQRQQRATGGVVANVFAIHSVGQSIADYLSKTYPPTLSGPHPCQFRVVASSELMQNDAFATTTISIYLFRVTVNEFLRGSARALAPNDVNIPLSLDLHYLVTAWAEDFLTEHLIMAWTMRQLYYRQTLTAAELSPEAEWGPSDVITLLPAEMSMPDMMRLWDVFEPKYRLSATYVARAVRIDTELDLETYPPVVSRRNQYEKQELK